MNDPIKVQKKVIGDSEINAVDARELHEFLEVKSDFKNWIKNYIRDFNFKEDEDFMVGKNLPVSTIGFQPLNPKKENEDFVGLGKNLPKPKGGRPTKEYIISIDMAKELSMLQRTIKGKEARLYFIQCEKNLKEIISPQCKLPKTFGESLRMLADEVDKNEILQIENNKLELKIEKDKDKVDFAESIILTENAISIGDFAKLLKDENIKMGQNKLFAWLRKHEFLMSGWKKRNIPYQRFIDSGYFQVVETTYVNNGVDYLTTKTLVTGKGQVAIIQKIKEI